MCPTCILWNLHSWLISSGVQLDLSHMEEDIFKSINILGGPISMAGGRLDSCFGLGSLIQGLDTQNMIFGKTSEIKTDHKIFLRNLNCFKLVLLKIFLKNVCERSGSQNRLTPYWLGPKYPNEIVNCMCSCRRCYHVKVVYVVYVYIHIMYWTYCGVSDGSSTVYRQEVIRA